MAMAVSPPSGPATVARTVSVTVANTGTMDGVEVVLVYVQYLVRSKNIPCRAGLQALSF